MEDGVEDDPDVGYTALCSSLTLQSNKQGFFGAFADYVTRAAQASGWLQNSFHTRETDAGRINAVLEDKEIYGIVSETLSHVQELYRKKSSADSRERRKDAQKALEQKEFNKALVLASQAVLKAPMPDNDDLVEGGLSLALALWLRSECLLELGEYELALRDLKLALKERLPAKQRAEYYWRVGKCYKGLGEYSRSKVSYDLAIRLLGNNNDLKKRVSDDISELKIAEESGETNQVHSEIFEPTLSDGRNDEFTSMSKLVRIATESGKGRFVQAKTEIATGDVLLIEEPYAACLLPDMLGSHCCHCFKTLVAPVWCSVCAAVAYCSPECKDIATQTYHVYECKLMDLLIGSGMSVLCHIALRMVTQIGLKKSLQLHTDYIINYNSKDENSLKPDKPDVKPAQSPKPNRSKKIRPNKKAGRDRPSNEQLPMKESSQDDTDIKLKAEIGNQSKEEEKKKELLIYSLCTHSERRSAKDYLHRTLMALFLLKCLQKSNFFNERSDPNALSSNELAIGELLLRNLQLLQFNAHEVYETVRSKQHKFNGAKASYLAVAIYPSGALFNHECHPAVGRYFIGKKIVMTALRPLSCNSVVAENYGPICLMKSKEERQKSLAGRYWFKCDCLPCQQNWPTLKQMAYNDIPRIRCPNNACSKIIPCSVNKNGDKVWSKSCYGCNLKIDNYEMLRRYETLEDESICQYHVAAKLMEEQDAFQAKAILCKAINIFYEFAAQPHKETMTAQETLRSCLANQGNTRIIPPTSQEVCSIKTLALNK